MYGVIYCISAGCWWMVITNTLLEKTTSAQSLSTWAFSLHLSLTPMSYSEVKHCRLLAYCSRIFVRFLTVSYTSSSGIIGFPTAVSQLNSSLFKSCSRKATKDTMQCTDKQF